MHVLAVSVVLSIINMRKAAGVAAGSPASLAPPSGTVSSASTTTITSCHAVCGSDEQQQSLLLTGTLGYAARLSCNPEKGPLGAPELYEENSVAAEQKKQQLLALVKDELSQWDLPSHVHTSSMRKRYQCFQQHQRCVRYSVRQCTQAHQRQRQLSQLQEPLQQHRERKTEGVLEQQRPPVILQQRRQGLVTTLCLQEQQQCDAEQVHRRDGSDTAVEEGRSSACYSTLLHTSTSENATRGGKHVVRTTEEPLFRQDNNNANSIVSSHRCTMPPGARCEETEQHKRARRLKENATREADRETHSAAAPSNAATAVSCSCCTFLKDTGNLVGICSSAKRSSNKNYTKRRRDKNEKQMRGICVHTGAGVSTSAGIADFRGPSGAWTLEAKGKSIGDNPPQVLFGRHRRRAVGFHLALPTPAHLLLQALTTNPASRWLPSLLPEDTIISPFLSNSSLHLHPSAESRLDASSLSACRTTSLSHFEAVTRGCSCVPVAEPFLSSRSSLLSPPISYVSLRNFSTAASTNTSTSTTSDTAKNILLSTSHVSTSPSSVSPLCPACTGTVYVEDVARSSTEEVRDVSAFSYPLPSPIAPASKTKSSNSNGCGCDPATAAAAAILKGAIPTVSPLPAAAMSLEAADALRSSPSPPLTEQTDGVLAFGASCCCSATSPVEWSASSCPFRRANSGRHASTANSETGFSVVTVVGGTTRIAAASATRPEILTKSNAEGRPSPQTVAIVSLDCASGVARDQLVGAAAAIPSRQCVPAVLSNDVGTSVDAVTASVAPPSSVGTAAGGTFAAVVVTAAGGNTRSTEMTMGDTCAAEAAAVRNTAAGAAAAGEYRLKESIHVRAEAGDQADCASVPALPPDVHTAARDGICPRHAATAAEAPQQVAPVAEVFQRGAGAAVNVIADKKGAINRRTGNSSSCCRNSSSTNSSSGTSCRSNDSSNSISMNSSNGPSSSNDSRNSNSSINHSSGISSSNDSSSSDGSRIDSSSGISNNNDSSCCTNGSNIDSSCCSHSSNVYSSSGISSSKNTSNGNRSISSSNNSSSSTSSSNNSSSTSLNSTIVGETALRDNAVKIVCSLARESESLRPALAGACTCTVKTAAAAVAGLHDVSIIGCPLDIQSPTSFAVSKEKAGGSLSINNTTAISSSNNNTSTASGTASPLRLTAAATADVTDTDITTAHEYAGWETDVLRRRRERRGTITSAEGCWEERKQYKETTETHEYGEPADISDQHKLPLVNYIITQNVDGLHARCGTPFSRLGEVHGSMFVERCDACARRYLRDFPLPTLSFQPTGRLCGICTDVLLDWFDIYEKPFRQKAQAHARAAALHLCLGTSLQVQPACHFPSRRLRRRDSKLVIANLQETPLDAEATLCLRLTTDEVAEALAAGLGITGISSCCNTSAAVAAAVTRPTEMPLPLHQSSSSAPAASSVPSHATSARHTDSSWCSSSALEKTWCSLSFTEGAAVAATTCCCLHDTAARRPGADTTAQATSMFPDGKNTCSPSFMEKELETSQRNSCCFCCHLSASCVACIRKKKSWRVGWQWGPEGGRWGSLAAVPVSSEEEITLEDEETDKSSFDGDASLPEKRDRRNASRVAEIGKENSKEHQRIAIGTAAADLLTGRKRERKESNAVITRAGEAAAATVKQDCCDMRRDEEEEEEEKETSSTCKMTLGVCPRNKKKKKKTGGLGSFIRTTYVFVLRLPVNCIPACVPRIIVPPAPSAPGTAPAGKSTEASRPAPSAAELSAPAVAAAPTEAGEGAAASPRPGRPQTAPAAATTGHAAPTTKLAETAAESAAAALPSIKRNEGMKLQHMRSCVPTKTAATISVYGEERGTATSHHSEAIVPGSFPAAAGAGTTTALNKSDALLFHKISPKPPSQNTYPTKQKPSSSSSKQPHTHVTVLHSGRIISGRSSCLSSEACNSSIERQSTTYDCRGMLCSTRASSAAVESPRSVSHLKKKIEQPSTLFSAAECVQGGSGCLSDKTSFKKHKEEHMAIAVDETAAPETTATDLKNSSALSLSAGNLDRSCCGGHHNTGAVLAGDSDLLLPAAARRAKNAYEACKIGGMCEKQHMISAQKPELGPALEIASGRKKRGVRQLREKKKKQQQQQQNKEQRQQQHYKQQQQQQKEHQQEEKEKQHQEKEQQQQQENERVSRVGVVQTETVASLERSKKAEEREQRRVEGQDSLPETTGLAHEVGMNLETTTTSTASCSDGASGDVNRSSVLTAADSAGMDEEENRYVSCRGTCCTWLHQYLSELKSFTEVADEQSPANAADCVDAKTAQQLVRGALGKKYPKSASISVHALTAASHTLVAAATGHERRSDVAIPYVETSPENAVPRRQRTASSVTLCDSDRTTTFAHDIYSSKKKHASVLHVERIQDAKMSDERESGEAGAGRKENAGELEGCSSTHFCEVLVINKEEKAEEEVEEEHEQEEREEGRHGRRDRRLNSTGGLERPCCCSSTCGVEAAAAAAPAAEISVKMPNILSLACNVHRDSPRLALEKERENAAYREENYGRTAAAAQVDSREDIDGRRKRRRENSSSKYFRNTVKAAPVAALETSTEREEEEERDRMKSPFQKTSTKSTLQKKQEGRWQLYKQKQTSLSGAKSHGHLPQQQQRNAKIICWQRFLLRISCATKIEEISAEEEGEAEYKVEGEEEEGFTTLPSEETHEQEGRNEADARRKSQGNSPHALSARVTHVDALRGLWSIDLCKSMEADVWQMQLAATPNTPATSLPPSPLVACLSPVSSPPASSSFSSSASCALPSCRRSVPSASSSSSSSVFFSQLRPPSVDPNRGVCNEEIMGRHRGMNTEQSLPCLQALTPSYVEVAPSFSAATAREHLSKDAVAPPTGKHLLHAAATPHPTQHQAVSKGRVSALPSASVKFSPAYAPQKSNGSQKLKRMTRLIGCIACEATHAPSSRRYNMLEFTACCSLSPSNSQDHLYCSRDADRTTSRYNNVTECKFGGYRDAENLSSSFHSSSSSRCTSDERSSGANVSTRTSSSCKSYIPDSESKTFPPGAANRTEIQADKKEEEREEKDEKEITEEVAERVESAGRCRSDEAALRVSDNSSNILDGPSKRCIKHDCMRTSLGPQSFQVRSSHAEWTGERSSCGSSNPAESIPPATPPPASLSLLPLTQSVRSRLSSCFIPKAPTTGVYIGDSQQQRFNPSHRRMPVTCLCSSTECAQMNERAVHTLTVKETPLQHARDTASHCTSWKQIPLPKALDILYRVHALATLSPSLEAYSPSRCSPPITTERRDPCYSTSGDKERSKSPCAASTEIAFHQVSSWTGSDPTNAAAAPHEIVATSTSSPKGSSNSSTFTCKTDEVSVKSNSIKNISVEGATDVKQQYDKLPASSLPRYPRRKTGAPLYPQSLPPAAASSARRRTNRDDMSQQRWLYPAALDLYLPGLLDTHTICAYASSTNGGASLQSRCAPFPSQLEGGIEVCKNAASDPFARRHATCQSQRLLLPLVLRPGLLSPLHAVPEQKIIHNCYWQRKTRNCLPSRNRDTLKSSASAASCVCVAAVGGMGLHLVREGLRGNSLRSGNKNVSAEPQQPTDSSAAGGQAQGLWKETETRRQDALLLLQRKDTASLARSEETLQEIGREDQHDDGDTLEDRPGGAYSMQEIRRNTSCAVQFATEKKHKEKPSQTDARAQDRRLTRTHTDMEMGAEPGNSTSKTSRGSVLTKHSSVEGVTLYGRADRSGEGLIRTASGRSDFDIVEREETETNNQGSGKELDETVPPVRVAMYVCADWKFGELVDNVFSYVSPTKTWNIHGGSADTAEGTGKLRYTNRTARESRNDAKKCDKRSGTVGASRKAPFTEQDRERPLRIQRLENKWESVTLSLLRNQSDGNVRGCSTYDSQRRVDATIPSTCRGKKQSAKEFSISSWKKQHRCCKKTPGAVVCCADRLTPLTLTGKRRGQRNEDGGREAEGAGIGGLEASGEGLHHLTARESTMGASDETEIARFCANEENEETESGKTGRFHRSIARDEDRKYSDNESVRNANDERVLCHPVYVDAETWQALRLLPMWLLLFCVDKFECM